MIQTHTIVLWRKPEIEEPVFEDLAEYAFEVMSIFQEFDSEWRPNYLTGYKKSNKKIQWNYQNFLEIFKNGVNREGEKIFKKLGYGVSFFSSLDEDKSFGFSLTVGSTSFMNVFTVHIAVDVDLNDVHNANKIEILFEKLVKCFVPFWGCVANSKIASKYGYFDKLKGIPLTVHWLNYFDEDVIEMIGREKIKDVISGHDDVSFKEGILKLRDIPFDYERDDDIKFHNEIHLQLIQD